MEEKDIRFVDGHLHLDIAAVKDPGRASWLAEKGCLAVSWAFGLKVLSKAALEVYLVAQERVMARLAAEGLAVRFLTGVHPRNIPADFVREAVPGLLRPHLAHPLCAGIGEIGLETGSEREKGILAAQLTLAGTDMARGKVIGIHTPRGDKDRITAQLLDFMEDFPLDRNRVVMDHASPSTIGAILERGYFAGITLSPVKTSPAELAAMLEAHASKADRIMVNTDSGLEFHEDLFSLLSSGLLPDEVLRKITRDNALAFYGLA